MPFPARYDKRRSYNQNYLSAKLPKVIRGLVKNYWPALAIIVIVFAFLSNLFFPKLSLFVIPDYGRSDSWSLSIADSFYYSQEIKHNSLPIWNPHIGNGFPVFAEGQTGELFPLNIVLFKLFPFALAYNFTLAFSLITAATGTYLFCRSLKLSILAATFAGLVFSLGGFFTFHLQHHALLETASLFPWVFWTVNEFIITGKLGFLLSISVASAFQMFAGFPQLVFYTQVSSFAYVLLNLLSNDRFKIKPLILVIAAFVLGYFLAAVQLLPTYEFLKQSTRVADPAEILTQFPYMFKNLLQFLNPYILGTPKEGTYPLWQPGKWGIFWESSAYIGIVPLILGLGAIFGNIFKTKKNVQILYISALMLFAVLLALGEASPLYVILTIPPFSLFRVPSRFLLTVQFLIVVLAAIYLNKITKKTVALFLIAFSLVNIFVVLKNYNPLLHAKKLLQNPDSVQFLNTNSATNIYTIGLVNKWNENFLIHGWVDISKFYFFENYLDQNSNLIFNIDQFSAYESLETKRQAFLKSQVASLIKFEDGKYRFSEKAIKLLAANNVSHIISPYEINAPDVQKVYFTSTDENSVNIYEISNPSGIVFLSNNYVGAETIPDITQAVSKDDFDPQNSPIIEGNIKEQPSKSQGSNVQVVSRTDTNLLVSTQTDNTHVLIFNQSYYPGWQAYIDNKETSILPANINSMAIEVPSGKHIVAFRYHPGSLIVGALLSSLVFLSMLFVFLKFRNLVLFKPSM